MTKYVIFNFGEIPHTTKNNENYSQKEFSIRPNTGMCSYKTNIIEQIKKHKANIIGYIPNIGYVSLKTFINWIDFLGKEIFPDIYCSPNITL